MEKFVKKIGDKWVEYPVEVEIAFQKIEEWSGLDRTTICKRLKIVLPEDMPSADVVTVSDKRYSANY